MTRSTLASMTVNLTDATSMRAAFQKVSDALTEVGVLVESTVTGQIDIATAVYPAAPAAVTYFQLGYQVRKLEQAGLPTIFIRIDYQVYFGTAVNTSGLLAVRMNFGTSVSTSGVLSGVNRPNALITNSVGNSVQSSAARAVIIASDGANYLTFMIGYNDNTYTSSFGFVAFTMERTRDRLSGGFDGEGVVFGYATTYTGFDSLTGVPVTAARLIAWNIASGTIGFQGGPTFASIGSMWGTTGSGTGDAASLSPLPIGLPKLKAVATCMLGYWRDEIAQTTEFDVVMYATTIKYVALGSVGNGMNDIAIGAPMRAAFRAN